jgi:hypothetical protein
MLSAIQPTPDKNYVWVTNTTDQTDTITIPSFEEPVTPASLESFYSSQRLLLNGDNLIGQMRAFYNNNAISMQYYDGSQWLSVS